ncbi:maleylacetate reductase [Gordonia amarae NBRC 15530]|uniref:Maleylacetate reductase n=2 Tax=Gordonia amarae TaxID=36821 RepID=G7GLS0_9ACTN|nr:maleylacetate reductase [Gordonia amarae NBRC 15530]
MTGMRFDHTTLGQRILFGSGQAADNVRLAAEGFGAGASRILLIADAFAAEIADAVVGKVAVVARISDIVQHVPAGNARAAVSVATESGADAVVSIGGGSAVGLAKIIARDLHLPVIAVPTTFAGSEATDVWGQTENNRKVTGSDPHVLPKVVVYDATLSRSLPGQLAVASGLNAVAHAVDGFWAPRADPINKALGTEGLRALIPGLRALGADPDDLAAREQTLYGAYLAAVAFASAGSGLHHKICHVLGGAYGLSHSETHAIVLAYVTALNAPAAADAAQRISQALGKPDPATGLFELRRDLGVVGSLAELGMPESGIDDAVAPILAAAPVSNPVPATEENITALLRKAWAGEDPT